MASWQLPRAESPTPQLYIKGQSQPTRWFHFHSLYALFFSFFPTTTICNLYTHLVLNSLQRKLVNKDWVMGICWTSPASPPDPHPNTNISSTTGTVCFNIWTKKFKRVMENFTNLSFLQATYLDPNILTCSYMGCFLNHQNPYMIDAY